MTKYNSRLQFYSLFLFVYRFPPYLGYCVLPKERDITYIVSRYIFSNYLFFSAEEPASTSSVSPVYYTGCLIDSWKIFFSATFASFPGSRLLRHETFVEELKTAWFRRAKEVKIVFRTAALDARIVSTHYRAENNYLEAINSPPTWFPNLHVSQKKKAELTRLNKRHIKVVKITDLREDSSEAS